MTRNQAEKKVLKAVKRLAEARKEKGISYQRLSEMTGLHRTALSLIERGERTPTLLSYILIADALGISLVDFSN